RAMKVEPIRESSGDHVVGCACESIRIQLFQILELQRVIVGAVAVDSDKDSSSRAGDSSFRQTGIFQSVPSCLKENSLLRVQAGRLVRSYVEERRIEPPHIVEKSAPPGIYLSRCEFARMEVITVPTVRWNTRDCIAPFHDHLPELVLISATARKAHAHADNGNRL